MYTYMYIEINIHVYMCMCKFVYMYVWFIYTYTHTHQLNAFIKGYHYPHTNKHIYIPIYTYIHTKWMINEGVESMAKACVAVYVCVADCVAVRVQ